MFVVVRMANAIQTCFLFIAMANAIRPMFSFVIPMANIIKPYFVLYCDSRRNKAVSIAMANAITPKCFCYCDGRRYETSVSSTLRRQTLQNHCCFLFIVMANAIQPFFCLLRWQTLYNHAFLLL